MPVIEIETTDNDRPWAPIHSDTDELGAMRWASTLLSGFGPHSLPPSLRMLDRRDGMLTGVWESGGEFHRVLPVHPRVGQCWQRIDQPRLGVRLINDIGDPHGSSFRAQLLYGARGVTTVTVEELSRDYVLLEVAQADG